MATAAGVILHTDELMMVEFGFDKGGVGALHSHPHVQSSYVAEGRFEVTIDGRSEIVEKGGALHRAVGPGAWRQGVGGRPDWSIRSRRTAPISCKGIDAQDLDPSAITWKRGSARARCRSPRLPGGV